VATGWRCSAEPAGSALVHSPRGRGLVNLPLRATTARGEFTSSNQLIYSAIAVTAIALAFAASALFPPASNVVNPLHYLYVAMIVAALAMSFYAVVLLKAVVNYYTPRRK